MNRRFMSGAVFIVLLFSGLANADQDYFAVFMGGQKVGYTVQSRTVADGTVTTSEEMNITVTRFGMPVTMNVVETYIETVKAKPVGFKSKQDMSIMVSQMSGVIRPDGTMKVVADQMGTQQTQILDWPEGALMAEGLKLMSLEKGLKEGTAYSAKVFSPSMLQVFDVNVIVGETENVDLLGKVLSLTKTTTFMKVPGAGPVVTVSYVDEQMKLYKSLTPIMGMQIEIVACDEQIAKGDINPLELSEKMFVKSPAQLNPQRATSITYRLSPIPGETIDIPSSDNQRVKKLADGSMVVTVSPVAVRRSCRIPYCGRDEEALEALKPTRFLQSDDPKIVELAKKAIGGTRDAYEAAKKIETFAAGYLSQINLSVGYASAAEVAESRVGDCTEFSVLTAAMCRAVGIPSRLAVGIAYVEMYESMVSAFGGHAWTEVYIDGKWVGLDASFTSSDRGGYGPGHIALAYGNGGPEDFLQMLSSFGKFTIVKAVEQ